MNRQITEYIAPKSDEIITNDGALIKHMQDIDKMIELDWDLPDAVKNLKWMRTVKSTDPLAAIITGRRTLATIDPIPFIQPLNSNIITKKLANQNEHNLSYQLRQANKRSEHNIVGDIVESALRYDMVTAFVVPIKWQIQGTGKFYEGGNKGFMVDVYNPQEVHPRFSPLGLECVVTSRVMKADACVAFFGKNAKGIKDDVESKNANKSIGAEWYIRVYDYWELVPDGVLRATWAGGLFRDSNIPDNPTDAQYLINKPEVIDMRFMPWVIKKGGTSLAINKAHSLRPMLGPVAHGKIWELQNIAKSLAFAEALAYSASPRYKITTLSDGSIRIDYGDINKPVILKPGEDIEVLLPPAIDDNLLHILDRSGVEIDRLTGVKNLSNLEAPSGTAFATINAVIKAATASLDPYKEVSEEALGSVFEKMLLWTEYTGDTMIGYGYKDADMGKRYELKPEFIEPEEIDVTVKLTANIPTDQIQRINAAVMLKEQLDFSKEDAYKEIDVPNPEEVMARRHQEMLNETELANAIKRMQAETDLEIQQKQMGLQMQAQQAAQMQAQEQAQRQAGLQQGAVNQAMAGRTGAPRERAQSMAAMALQGDGFNPARGGQSPNVGAPESLLRENVSGMDRRGGAV